MKSEYSVPKNVELERVWLNPERSDTTTFPLSLDHVKEVHEADLRLRRFAPLLAKLFPELAADNGIIESPLMDVSAMARVLGASVDDGKLLAKADHMLPVAGSIKARGGIHAVLSHAEEIARADGLLKRFGHEGLGNDEAKAFFAKHTLAVGSTGNLGLSVGTMAAALGFRTIVHMSSDAKEWKKQRLRNAGVIVVEHEGDYEEALASGRADCAADPMAYFIDDEDSLPLLYGYATAISRLKKQLADQEIVVDADHPLFVYIPCGVGGAPAGIALGLHIEFGPAAHVFYVEPTETPCMMIAVMARQEHDDELPSIYDFGLSGKTEADGLAVPRASRCAVDISAPLISGILTTSDQVMLKHMADARRLLETKLEPSAAAGFSGVAALNAEPAMREYIRRSSLLRKMRQSTHLVWLTGGALMPDELFQEMIRAVNRN